MQNQDELLIIEASLTGSTAVVALRGEMDITTTWTLHDQVIRLIESGATTVDIDMAEVTFMDSTGLGGLLEIRRLGASLVIRNPSSPVKRILDLVLIGEVAGVTVVDGHPQGTPPK